MATSGGRVEHDAGRSRFVYVNAEEKMIGTLDYEEQTHKNKRILDLQHTVVDPAGRGQGIAQKLCDAAFEYAREQGCLIIPTCSYISATYLKRIPHANDLVVASM